MNLGSIAKQVLGAVAPTLLSAIGGPFAPLAAAILHAALGTQGDEKAADTALANASQDTLFKVKQAELDLQGKLGELGIQREQLVYNDLANARSRQVALKDDTPAKLAWMMIGGFLAISLAQIVAMIGFAEQVAKIPPQGWLLIGNISGYLANEAKQAGAYFFGSSLGSQSKDATLAEIARQP